MHTHTHNVHMKFNCIVKKIGTLLYPRCGDLLKCLSLALYDSKCNSDDNSKEHEILKPTNCDVIRQQDPLGRRPEESLQSVVYTIIRMCTCACNIRNFVASTSYLFDRLCKVHCISSVFLSLCFSILSIQRGVLPSPPKTPLVCLTLKDSWGSNWPKELCYR